ncbi:MAG: radical SAM protein [Deltaproteobacteria bacterium]|nr:radical SAM protein [Deltaproteobacteria bacterium]
MMQDGFLYATRSVCPSCGELVDAKAVVEGGRVLLVRRCPRHGELAALACSDAEWYARALATAKAASVPHGFSTKADRPCPEACGLCPEHQQHTCLPVIDVTQRCDLRCPACLVSCEGETDLSVDAFRRIVDGVLAREGAVDTINLSGGEPLLHPDLPALLGAAARAEVARVSLNSNGLLLLERPDLVAALKEHEVTVALQWDGDEAEPYRVLRGRDLREEKRRVLNLLERHGIRTTLIVTAAAGLGERVWTAAMDEFLARPNVTALQVQPVAHVGRGAGLAHDPLRRLTIPDVIDGLCGASRGLLARGDFTPLPCCHGACFGLTYLLRVPDGGVVPLPRLFPFDDFEAAVTNTAVPSFDGQALDRLRGLVYNVWSGCDAYGCGERLLGALRSVFDEFNRLVRVDARALAALAERSVKVIFIHAFMDAETFDMVRAAKCCVHYAQPDGRMIPACVHNVLRRRRV